MLIAKVIGTVVSTRKNNNLIGCKFLVVEAIEQMNNNKLRMVAVDQVGAGIGDTVLVTLGSAARIESYNNNSSIDAAIVGIVDNENEIVIVD